jgi:hypothetical protein
VYTVELTIIASFIRQLPGLWLTVLGIVVVWLAGNKSRTAWSIGIVAQGFWMAYAIWLSQWGLLVGTFVYVAVYARNWRRWGADYLVEAIGGPTPKI